MPVGGSIHSPEHPVHGAAPIPSQRLQAPAGHPGPILHQAVEYGSSGQSAIISGFLRLWAGQTDLAIEHAGRALRLSPRALASGSSFLIGAALFFGRRFEQAVLRLRVHIEDTPLFPTPYRFLAACYAHMGLLDEARAMIARLREITAVVMVNYPLPFRDPGHRELYLSGLRLALGESIVQPVAASPRSGPSQSTP